MLAAWRIFGLIQNSTFTRPIVSPADFWIDPKNPLVSVIVGRVADFWVNTKSITRPINFPADFWICPKIPWVLYSFVRVADFLDYSKKSVITRTTLSYVTRDEISCTALFLEYSPGRKAQAPSTLIEELDHAGKLFAQTFRDL